MSRSNEPSKFTLSINAGDDEIWGEILSTLSPQQRKLADWNKSEIYEPYFGAKEIIVKSENNLNIAFASISEQTTRYIEWAVYKEF